MRELFENRKQPQRSQKTLKWQLSWIVIRTNTKTKSNGLRETCNAAEAAAAKAIQYDTKYYSNFINLTYQNTRLLFAVILPEMSEMSMSVGNKVFCRISWLGRFIVEKNIMLGMVSIKTCDKLDASL